LSILFIINRFIYIYNASLGIFNGLNKPHVVKEVGVWHVRTWFECHNVRQGDGCKQRKWLTNNSKYKELVSWLYNW
jgi:hypothetical protein